MRASKIVEELKSTGFSITSVKDFLGRNINYEKTARDFRLWTTRPEIVHQAELLKEGRPLVNRTKYFEFQNKQLLGEGLSLENSSLIQFYLDNKFLEVAESYLETNEARIRNCLAFYHPENPMPPSNSQNWHRDTEDTKILKIFVYYNDVRASNGALWYVKNSSFGKKNDSIWPNVGQAPHGYLDLEATMKIPYSDVVNFEGPEGTICFFDANGFHRGGKVSQGYRISTHCCYIKSTAPHIVNGVLPTFEYDEDVNSVNRQGKHYKSLSKRQKKYLN